MSDKPGGSGRSGRRATSIPGGYASARLSLETAPATFDAIFSDPSVFFAGTDTADPLAVQRRVYELQGYDQKPDMITQAEFEAYGDAGEVQMFRGMTGGPNGPTEYAEAFMTGGQHFVGRGIYGNGSYTAVGRNGPKGRPNAKAERTADDYAEGGTVLRMTLRREARVTTYNELQEKRAAYQSKHPQASHSVGIDMGAFAAALGYDAYYADGGNYMVVLNRGVVRVVR